jgi:hypothetical protein
MVDVAAVAPLIVSELELKLQVGGSMAPVGLEVTAQLRLTVAVPVNVVGGVTVIVDVFPVVAPGATLTAVPVMVKLPIPVLPPVTVREIGVLAVFEPLVPVTVIV